MGGEAINCCTYGTVGSKSAIITACRGLDISEISQEISSLIPIERGFNWTLSDCYYGNEKLNRKPITEFKNLIDSQEGLWELASMLEGVIISRGTHASGVFMTNDAFTNYNAKMRSPDGTLISQFDLHDSEFAGCLKYDFLTTSAMTKIRLALDMLCDNGHIERKETLKDTYMNALNPHTLDYNHKEIWDLVANNGVADLFQFDSQVAMSNVAQIQPTSLLELAQTNSLMRLQGGEDEGGNKKETPTERYVRYKKDITEWYRDMDMFEVPSQDQEKIKKILLQYNGVADTQEAIMLMSREINSFSIGEAHKLRSVIGKKKMKEIPKLKQFFFEKGIKNGVHENTLHYLWDEQVSLQLGYAFSILHCIAYTFIALQELVLYSQYPSIYWNCACLTVNSGGEEDNEEYIEDDEYEDDDELFFKKEKTKSTNYGKIATSIGQLQQKGVIITPPNIQKANYGFTPDEENNQIIFGLKGVTGVGDDAAYEIINNRPYSSLEDFHKRLVETKKDVTTTTGKTQQKSLVSLKATIALIKSGGFDIFVETTREDLLMKYLKFNFPDKNRLDLRTLESVMDIGIVPQEPNLGVRVNRFKNFIITKNNFIKNDETSKTKKWYILRGSNIDNNDVTIRFFEDNFLTEMEEDKDYYYNEQGDLVFSCKLKSCGFEKTFDKLTFDLKQWLNSSDCLDRYNKFQFNETIDKYAKGSISKWEMDSLSFYYHEHELAKINKQKYLIANFNDLPEIPVIQSYGMYKKREYPIYELTRIAGTVLDKNKNKHTVTLLTVSGDVVLLKFYSGQFGYYDKTVSQINDDGSKSVIENGWLKRGNLLMVTGYRNGGTFKPKKYKNSVYQHTLTLIEDVRDDGVLIMKTDRTRI